MAPKIEGFMEQVKLENVTTKGFLGKVQYDSVRILPKCLDYPMSVSPADVTQVARLARLKIPEDALPDVTDRFSRILDMVDELQQVDTQGIEPMSNPHDMVQRLRADQVTEPDQRAALQSVSPAVEQGYFLVPRVID